MCYLLAGIFIRPYSQGSAAIWLSFISMSAKVSGLARRREVRLTPLQVDASLKRCVNEVWTSPCGFYGAFGSPGIRWSSVKVLILEMGLERGQAATSLDVNRINRHAEGSGYDHKHQPTPPGIEGRLTPAERHSVSSAALRGLSKASHNGRWGT